MFGSFCDFSANLLLFLRAGQDFFAKSPPQVSNMPRTTRISPKHKDFEFSGHFYVSDEIWPEFDGFGLFGGGAWVADSLPCRSVRHGARSVRIGARSVRTYRAVVYATGPVVYATGPVVYAPGPAPSGRPPGSPISKNLYEIFKN
jgi:hypothetical protein